MARKRVKRNISCMPTATHFATIGHHDIIQQEINLMIDEFEALRLKDFQCLDQIKAAKIMGISQPTFHRLLKNARKKVADALVNNKIIKIHGGHYKLNEKKNRNP
jgi:predicted DNA-binding protein (UPF0251 family)